MSSNQVPSMRPANEPALAHTTHLPARLQPQPSSTKPRAHIFSERFGLLKNQPIISKKKSALLQAKVDGFAALVEESTRGKAVIVALKQQLEEGLGREEGLREEVVSREQQAQQKDEVIADLQEDNAVGQEGWLQMESELAEALEGLEQMRDTPDRGYEEELRNCQKKVDKLNRTLVVVEKERLEALGKLEKCKFSERDCEKLCQEYLASHAQLQIAQKAAEKWKKSFVEANNDLLGLGQELAWLEKKLKHREDRMFYSDRAQKKQQEEISELNGKVKELDAKVVEMTGVEKASVARFEKIRRK